MKKLIRNVEKNNVYDSDEEENPYASSVCLLIDVGDVSNFRIG